MTFKNLSLALCSLFLISCGSDGAGPKAKSTKLEKRGSQAYKSDGTSPSEETLIPGGRTWGRVYLDDSSEGGQTQEIFQSQVALLLEPQFKSEEIGDVSGIDDSALSEARKNETGVAFWAKGITVSGGLDPEKTNYTEQEDVFNPDTASLRISIYQGVEKAESPELITVEEVPIHFNDGIDPSVDSGKLVDSYINGNYIQLIFADEFGKISLSGRFDNNNFVGQVHFLTVRIDQDDTGTSTEVTRDAQLLGRFSVSTCGFFTCSN